MGPLIGVMPLYDEDRDSIWLLPGYQDLIEQNGGIPLILPLTTNKETLRPFLSICSGFLFTGGQDVAPASYGEEKQPVCGPQSLTRDEMELFFMKEVIAISTDGLIEGISLPGAKFVLGVQWHPEFFNAATVENQALMAAFLTACK